MKNKILNIAAIIIITATNLIASTHSPAKGLDIKCNNRALPTLSVIKYPKYFSEAMNLWSNDPNGIKKLKYFIIAMDYNASFVKKEDLHKVYYEIIQKLNSLPPEEFSKQYESLSEFCDLYAV